MKDISFEEYAGENRKKITGEFTECINSFNELHLSEIIKYCSSLMQEYGDVQYIESWYSYEGFEPMITVNREETDDEYTSRISKLKSEYRQYVSEQKRRQDSISAIEHKIQELNEQAEKLRKGK